LLHQLGEDLVLALQLGLEIGDLLVLGVGSVLAAFVVAGESSWAVLEKELLPGVEVGDSKAVFFTDVGDGDLVEEVLSEQGDLLPRTKMAALAGHGCSSARVLPLTLSKESSSSDWGKTVRAEEDAGQAIIICGREGVELVIVTAGAAHRQPQKGAADHI